MRAIDFGDIGSRPITLDYTEYDPTPQDQISRSRGTPGASAATLPQNRGRARLGWMVAPLTRITIDPKVCGGQPCVRGLRIPVSLVLKHLAGGKTPQQVVEEFPELEPEDIGECLRYAAWLASGRSVVSPSAA